MTKINFVRIEENRSKSARKVLLKTGDKKQQIDCINNFIEHYNAFHTLVALELVTRNTLVKSAKDAKDALQLMTVKAQRFFDTETEILDFYLETTKGNSNNEK